MAWSVWLSCRLMLTLLSQQVTKLTLLFLYAHIVLCYIFRIYVFYPETGQITEGKESQDLGCNRTDERASPGEKQRDKCEKRQLVNSDLRPLSASLTLIPPREREWEEGGVVQWEGMNETGRKSEIAP